MTQAQEKLLRGIGAFCAGFVLGPLAAQEPGLWVLAITLSSLFWGVFPFRALFGGRT